MKEHYGKHEAMERLIHAMRTEFGGDQKRIEHALKVLEYAQEILDGEGGNHDIVVAAAILHDIGIKEAERKHGSSAPKYQELEGPFVARRILKESGAFDETDIEHVCRIVGSHHSGKDIDTLEFEIVWDADWLVNFRDIHPCEFGSDCKTRGKQCIKRFDKIFRTATGRKLAEEKLLPDFETRRRASTESLSQK